MFSDQAVTSVSMVSLQPFLEARVQPEMVFDYKTGEKWFVVAGPIQLRHDADTLVQYNEVMSGDLIRVPLFSYTTRDNELTTLLGFAIDVGMRACLALPKRPKRLHLALGDPVIRSIVENAGQSVERFQAFFGIAFQL